MRKQKVINIEKEYCRMKTLISNVHEQKKEKVAAVFVYTLWNKETFFLSSIETQIQWLISNTQKNQ
jgi:hypothetical protein